MQCVMPGCDRQQAQLEGVDVPHKGCCCIFCFQTDGKQHTVACAMRQAAAGDPRFGYVVTREGSGTALAAPGTNDLPQTPAGGTPHVDRAAESILVRSTPIVDRMVRNARQRGFFHGLLAKGYNPPSGSPGEMPYWEAYDSGYALGREEANR